MPPVWGGILDILSYNKGAIMNTDKLTTYLGLFQAIATAGITYWTTAQQDGTIDFTSPVFWLGLTVSVLMAVKGYYTNK